MTLEKKIEALKGDIVSFSYNEYNITGIINKVVEMDDGGENITEIEIIPFSEWGKEPENQGMTCYYLDQISNYQVLSSVRYRKE